MPRDRRRSRRQTFPRPATAPAASYVKEIPRQRIQDSWRWRTFPVFFTFAATMFLTAVLAEIVSQRLVVAVLVIIAAVPLSIALAHLVRVILLSRLPGQRG